MGNTVDTSLMLSNYQQSQSTGSSALGKDDFLKLLITQLQNQDPTNPMDNTEFISQMATFSTLEQMTNINSSIMESSMMQASMMIGKTVSYLNDLKEDMTGIVKSVSFKNGEISFRLDDEENTSITSSQINTIS